MTSSHYDWIHNYENPERFIIYNFFEVEKAVEEINIRGIVPDAIFTTQESALVFTSKLAEAFHLLINDVDTIMNSRDKALMKKRWLASGVRTAKNTFFDDSMDFDVSSIDLNYPIIIKPAQGYASCGVKRVDNEKELIMQIKSIRMFNKAVISKENHGQSLGILVEEYIDGDEFSVDTIWKNGKALFSVVLSKGKLEGPYYPDKLYFIDPNLNGELRQKIINLSLDAALALGIKNGGTHTEIRLKNEEPYVLELSSRPGAGGLFYKLFEKAYDIPFTEIYYMIQQNDMDDKTIIEKLKNNKGKINEYFFFYSLSYEGKGVIKDIEGLEQLASLKEIFSCNCFAKNGDFILRQDMNPSYFIWILGSISSMQCKPDIFEFVKRYDDMVKIKFN